MDKERMEELAGDPRFIEGIYNYCDRWCERCAFTSRCMNYAVCEEVFDDADSHDMKNQAFWDGLSEVLAIAHEMLKEKARELGIDPAALDEEQDAGQCERIHEMAREQPCSQAAMKYIEMANEWFEQNEARIREAGEELESLARAEVPGTNPADDAIQISDCVEVIRWYQHPIYVKLCRAATGVSREELQEMKGAARDADGSAKVALIGIERSIAAWAALLVHLPDRERTVLHILCALQRLLAQVETTFPGARAFLRPGFDTR